MLLIKGLAGDSRLCSALLGIDAKELERLADEISSARSTQFPAFLCPASQRIFEAVNKQLSKQGYIARLGKLSMEGS